MCELPKRCFVFLLQVQAVFPFLVSELVPVFHGYVTSGISACHWFRRHLSANLFITLAGLLAALSALLVIWSVLLDILSSDVITVIYDP